MSKRGCENRDFHSEKDCTLRFLLPLHRSELLLPFSRNHSLQITAILPQLLKVIHCVGRGEEMRGGGRWERWVGAGKRGRGEEE
jgi:hypothetical protein